MLESRAERGALGAARDTAVVDVSFSTAGIPVPDVAVSSVHQSQYQTLRLARYDINGGTGHFVKFGTTPIPVPDTSVSSVRHQYR